MNLNSRNNQTDKKSPQAKEKANPQTKQGIEKPEKFEKSKKTGKKKELERENKVIKRQHSGFRNKCNPNREKKECPKLNLTKAGLQPDHLL